MAQRSDLRLLLLECKLGNVQHVRRMLENEQVLVGVHPLELHSETQSNCLIISIEYDQLEVTRVILEYLKNDNIYSRKELSPSERLYALKTSLEVGCYNDRSNHVALLTDFLQQEDEYPEVLRMVPLLELAATAGAVDVVDYLTSPGNDKLVADNDWYIAATCSARHCGHALIVERLVDKLQVCYPQRWLNLDPEKRFILCSAAGRMDELGELANQIDVSSNHWPERLSVAFSLSVCCGQIDIAKRLLGDADEYNSCAETGSWWNNAVKPLRVSLWENLAARAASMRSETGILNRILSHDSFVCPSKSSSLPFVTKGSRFIQLDSIVAHLKRWDARGEPFPRCQDLPADSFVDPSCCHSIWFVCHRWNSASHPDIPIASEASACTSQNQQLRKIVAFLEKHRRKYCPCFRIRSMCQHHKWDDGEGEVVGFFYDYMSLPQNPRSEEESATFRLGLEELDELATHAHFLAICPSVDERSDFFHRAWCFVEMCLALDYGGSLKWVGFLYANDDSLETDPCLTRHSLEHTRAAKQARMAHSEHLQDFFDSKPFQCTNKGDIVLLSRILREHLKASEVRRTRNDHARLISEQLEQLESILERRKEEQNASSFKQKKLLGRFKCACLARALEQSLSSNEIYGINDQTTHALTLYDDDVASNPLSTSLTELIKQESLPALKREQFIWLSCDKSFFHYTL